MFINPASKVIAAKDFTLCLNTNGASNTFLKPSKVNPKAKTGIKTKASSNLPFIIKWKIYGKKKTNKINITIQTIEYK